MTLKTEAREAMNRVLPELLQLKFGCEISMETHGDLGNLELTIIEPYKPDKTGKEFLCTKHMVWDGTTEHTTILGTPPTLNDILMSCQHLFVTQISKTEVIIYSNDKVKHTHYNLSAPFTDQSDEFYSFLIDILK